MLWGQLSYPPGTMDESAPTKHHHNQRINFGVKGGFTSSLFLVSDLVMDGVKIDEVQNNYKIGYFSSLFMRINFGKHFIQPEVSYNVNRCNITFEQPESTESNPASITSSIHSIDIPIIYGYNFIKEGPYSLAAFGGPKFRYIWNKKSEVTFENFDRKDIHEELYPLNASFTLGVAVTISRVFFDFRYDIGLHNISKKITYDNGTTNNNAEITTDETTTTDEIRFHRRDNVLSFSLGVFF
jgi:hypothetical protein